MRLLLDITTERHYCEIQGEEKELLKAVSMAITENPELSRLIRRSVEIADIAEADNPELCEEIRETFKLGATYLTGEK